jgi:excisionase family DNA binding protein
MVDEAFMTTEEVLQYLQVNLRTVYRMIKAGSIPAVRVGRQWRFRRSDLDQWLESQRLKTSEHAGPRSATVGPAESGWPDATGSSSRGSARPRVLVVDDEAPVRDLLRRALSLAEYDVELAENGQDALEHLRQVSYDLMLTDLRMPGIDGLTVIREARRFRPNLPVIILTGHSSEDAAIEAINLGVSGYLTKPLRVPRILAAAAKVLGD